MTDGSRTIAGLSVAERTDLELRLVAAARPPRDDADLAACRHGPRAAVLRAAAALVPGAALPGDAAAQHVPPDPVERVARRRGAAAKPRRHRCPAGSPAHHHHGSGRDTHADRDARLGRIDGSHRPRRADAGGARARGAPVGGAGGSAALRPGPRTAVPRRAAAAGSRGASAGAEYASHHQRWLVARGPCAGAYGILPGVQQRRGGGASRAADPVRRLRRVAAGAAPWRATGARIELLAGAASWCARGARATHRLPPAAGAKSGGELGSGSSSPPACAKSCGR